MIDQNCNSSTLKENLEKRLEEKSIFYPGNPLHDGAVLIRSETVVSAANINLLNVLFPAPAEHGDRAVCFLGMQNTSAHCYRINLGRVPDHRHDNDASDTVRFFPKYSPF